MIPAKITIIGDFWDCQIYRGRLYLWHTDLKLQIIDWNQLILSLSKRQIDELALTCAFLNGRILYSENLKPFLKDPDLSRIIRQRILHLTNTEIIIDKDRLNKYTLGIQDNPFKELHTDSEIFNNKIVAANYDGLYNVATHRPKSSKYLVSSRRNKLHDFIAYSLKANNYGRIALSGGNEGLYEFNTKHSSHYDDYSEEYTHYNTNIRSISKKHSSFADYNFLSIYNSSLIGESFLSLHKWRDKKDKDAPLIIQEKDINQTEIFGHINKEGVSWGNNEKIYLATNDMLHVVNFNNNSEHEDFFSKHKSYRFQAWKGRIIKGGISYFGTIVECENAVVVLMGDNDFYNIPGEITRWRVYPRSLNYENQLHVIFDDRLVVYSFNHDYLKNQDEKEFGIKFTPKESLEANYLTYKFG